MAESDDEDALLGALRQRDERAFAEVVTRHAPALRRVARRHIRDDALAEDVVQETWVALLRGIDGFEGRSSLRTWLIRVTANLAITAALRQQRSSPFSALAATTETSGEPGLPLVAPRSWDDPERRLFALEDRRRLREAFAGVPASQRAVVGLRDVEGLTADEVGARLGLTAGHQRVLLHRGRRRMAEALAEREAA